MSSSGHNALLFLINTLFGLYAYVLILRILLQIVRADFYNPLSQFIWRVTNPPTQLLRHVIPKFRQFDVAACILLWIWVTLNILLVLSILNVSASIPALFGLSAMKTVVLVLDLLSFCVIVQALMSWFGAAMHSPASSLLWNITEPLLRPVRRVMPPIGGLDLSPLVVIIGLQVLSRLIPLAYVLR